MKRAALLVVVCLWWAAAQGQAYPAKVVKVIAPYSSSAGPTIFMRLIAERLSKKWGKQVIVDSRPGASGFLAIEAVKNALPDGYELLVVSNAHVAINPALYKTLPYDPERDFAPVGIIYHTPFFVTVKSGGPYATVPALIAAAKAKPGKLTYGAPYVGSPAHLGAADFARRTGTSMILVPFRDQAQMYLSIASGDLDWALSTLASATPLAKAGRIRLLAIASARRSASAPDVPTMREAGGPDFEVDSWLALLAPRATPEAVVRKINTDMNAELAAPEVLERMKAMGFTASPGTPEQLAQAIRADGKTYAELVRLTGASAD